LGGAAVAVGGELRLCGVVGGNGRAAGGAGVGKRQREAAIVMMLEFSAELSLTNVIAPSFVKRGSDSGVFTIPAPLIWLSSAIWKSALLTTKEYAGAPALN